MKSIPYSFQGKQDAQGHHFTRVQIALTIFANPFHGIINPNEQLNDKILGGHGSLSFRLSLTRIVSDAHDFFKSSN
jgi:hypothetical protein